MAMIARPCSTQKILRQSQSGPKRACKNGLVSEVDEAVTAQPRVWKDLDASDNGAF